MNREKVMTFMKKSLRFLPDKAYIKLYYRLRVGRKLNMNDPETLNEKLQWLKFNYRFPLQSIVSDKLLVRDYVKEKIGEEYLIPFFALVTPSPYLLTGAENRDTIKETTFLRQQATRKTNYACGRSGAPSWCYRRLVKVLSS